MGQLPLEQFFTGAGLLYATVALLALIGLIIRGVSKDPVVRRRALLAVGLLLIFVILRVTLAEIPADTTGSILTPSGERIQGLVPNPAFTIVSVALLVVALLAMLLIVSMFFVDGMSKSGAGFPTFAMKGLGIPSFAVSVAVAIS